MMRTAASTSSGSGWLSSSSRTRSMRCSIPPIFAASVTSSSLITCHSDQAWRGLWCCFKSDVRWRLWLGDLSSQPASGISPYSRWGFFFHAPKWRTVGLADGEHQQGSEFSVLLIACLLAVLWTYRRKVTEESHLPGRDTASARRALEFVRIASASILIIHPIGGLRDSDCVFSGIDCRAAGGSSLPWAHARAVHGNMALSRSSLVRDWP